MAVKSATSGIPTPGPTGPAGADGATGSQGAAGAIGPAGPNVMGSPNSRTLSFATAYQATNNAKPAVVMVNLASIAGLSLTSGTTNTAQLIVGATSAVASGTGTIVGLYANSITGVLVVGLGINTNSTTPMMTVLPVGWFFAVLQTAGAVTIVSAFDQSVG